MSANEQPNDALFKATLGLYVLLYSASALLTASRQPLWMDEILTVWAARLPTAAQVIAAVRHGSEFAPPTFVLLIHFLNRISGATVWLRLPSILATLFIGGCTFVLFRRYLDPFRAAFAICLTLEGLRPWAVQVRPYALETACFAAALLCWDVWNRRQGRVWVIAIAVLLAAACSLHFYAVLFVPCVAVVEMLWSLRTRKFRLSLWVALFGAGASVSFWLPLIRAVSRFNNGDTGSPAYYAKPEVFRLMHSYADLFPRDFLIILILVASLLASGVGRMLDRDEMEAGSGSRDLTAFWSVVSGLVVFPALVFIVAKIFTGTFNERYTIAGVVGVSALIAANLTSTLTFRRSTPWILIAATLLTIVEAPMANPESFVAPGVVNFTDIAAKLSGEAPVVVADGLQFFPLEEYAPLELRSRIRYVTMPADVPVGDTTNQHQIERWKTINPALPVGGLDEFLRNQPDYFVVDFQTSDDTPAHCLLDAGKIELIAEIDGAMIYRSRVFGKS